MHFQNEAKINDVWFLFFFQRKRTVPHPGIFKISTACFLVLLVGSLTANNCGGRVSRRYKLVGGFSDCGGKLAGLKKRLAHYHADF